LQRVQEEKHTRFIDTLCYHYDAMYPADSDGAIRFGMVRRLDMEATKP
jgi:hypothetical protein